MGKVRKALAKLGDKQRYQFIGEFGGVGFKNNYGHYMPTLVLTDVKFNDQLVCDHLWFNYTKQFGQLGELTKGDLISFNGRVDSYLKGYYLNQSKDYKITYPNKIKLVNPKENKPLPLISDNKNALVGYIMQINKTFYKSTGRPYDDWYVKQYKIWNNFQKKMNKQK